MAVEPLEEQAILVNRSLSGDQDAFGELVDRYRNLVYGFLLNRIGDFEEAEDLTQEAFIEAYVHLGTLREPGKFSHWLCGITRNLCNEYLERDRRESEVLGQLVSQEEEAGRILVFRDGTEPPTPEDEYAYQEMKEAIWEAIAALPEKSREALMLSHFNEMSPSEIAEFLGVSPSTVRSRLQHGRERLKERMLPLAKEVMREKRLPRTFTKKVISALPLIPPRAPKPKPAPPLGRWIVSLKSKLLGMGLLALTAGLIGLLALGRGEKQPPEVYFPMFPSMRVRLATPDEMEQLAEHLEEEEETEMMTSRRSRLMTAVLGMVTAVAGTTATEAMAQGGSWITGKADIPTGRYGLSTSVVDGKIYAIGGGTDDGLSVTVDVYDFVTDTWTTKSGMPTPRANFATSVVDGKIYAIGGQEDPTGPALPTIEVYDPATDAWTQGADMPTPRPSFSTSVVDGKIYVIGGSLTPSGPALSTVEEYDPSTDTWTQKDDMPTARMVLSTSVVDDIIYAIGGMAGGSALPTVEAYNPVRDTWTQKDDMPAARMALSTSVAGGKIYAIGGLLGFWVSQSTVFEYNPATDFWTPKADMSTARFFLSTAVVDGKIYAMGGLQSWEPQVVLSTVEEYDPALDLGPDTSIETLFWGALKAVFR